MVRSMFAAIAGLRTHQSRMDVIGNNIANVNTNGYKAMRTVFKESLYQSKRNSSGGTDVYGGMNPSQVGYGCDLSSIDSMFTTGAYAPTDQGTDCMIDGNGFFLVGQKFTSGTANDDANQRPLEGVTNTLTPTEDQIGLDSLSLSRVGDFSFDGDGFLVDGRGNVVYGKLYRAADDGTGEYTEELYPICTPVVEDPDGGDENKPMNIGSISIDAAGVVTGVNKDDSGKTVIIGKLQIAFVQNPNALEKTQGPNYRIGANTGTVQAFDPTMGTTGRVISNGLEMANVDIAKEFSEMITTQRGFQANSRIITVTDAMLEELVNLKR